MTDQTNEPQDIWAMSSDAATEKLTQIAKDYAASTGQAPQQPSTPTVDDLLKAQAAAADAQDAAGLSDYLAGVGLPASEQAGREVLAWAQGGTIDATMQRQARERLDALGRNPEFVRNLLQGGSQELRMLTIANTMINAEAKP
ncbi:hypothetical protein ACNJX9_17820 [Bradyrhizobium sp. DASA03076]|uniref:hypothetical protein n=1 Tax=Bradyrhizobium sp. BLXBL-03 TaxID=3395916 RepID=UPI003F71772D